MLPSCLLFKELGRLCQKRNAADADYAIPSSRLQWVPVLEFQGFRNLLVLRFQQLHDQGSLQVL